MAERSFLFFVVSFQVSTTTPPSNEPEPTPMAELDAAAVETMIADNGLNEVTLKVKRIQLQRQALSLRLRASILHQSMFFFFHSRVLFFDGPGAGSEISPEIDELPELVAG